MTSAGVARCVPVATVTSPTLGELLSIGTNNAELAAHLMAVFGGVPAAGAEPRSPLLEVEQLVHPWPRWNIRHGSRAPTRAMPHAVLDQVSDEIAGSIADLGHLVVSGSAVLVDQRVVILISGDAARLTTVVSALTDLGCDLLSHGVTTIGDDGRVIATGLPVLVRAWEPWWSHRPSPLSDEVTSHSQFVPLAQIGTQAAAVTTPVHAIVHLSAPPNGEIALETMTQAITAVSMLPLVRGRPPMRIVESVIGSSICLHLETSPDDLGAALLRLMEAL